MRAEVLEPDSPAVTRRCVLVWADVADIEGWPAGSGPVVVWWDLGRSNRWKCKVHGRTTGPDCQHAAVAARALARNLFEATR